MKNVARALLLTAAVAASLPSTTAWADTPPASTAGNEKEGREHFLRGVDFSRDGDFRAALIEFRRAHELAPNYRVLYNIGQTALELQDYAQSLEAFEKYLTEGGNEVPADRRTQVEAEVKRLSNRVANVTVTVNVPGASILVDDIVVATAPLEHPIRIGAGRHKFSASSSDMTPVSRVVDLAGGESTTVALELVSQQRGATDPAAAPAPPPEPPSRTPLWVGIGVTSALAVGTAVMGVIAASDKSAFEDELGKYSPTGNRSAISSARDSVQTSALVFDVLAAATIVSAGVTLVIGLTGGSSSSQSSAKARPGLLSGTF